MKDPYFKYLALTLIAGVVIGSATPAKAAENTPAPHSHSGEGHQHRHHHQRHGHRHHHRRHREHTSPAG